MSDLPAPLAQLSESDEAVVVVDREGVVRLMSPPAEKLLGVTADDLVGEYIEMVVPEDKRWGHQAYRRGYLAEPSDREMDPGLHPEAERPDGEKVPVAVRLEPRTEDGVPYVVAHVTAREG